MQKKREAKMDHYRGGREEGEERWSECEDRQKERGKEREREREEGSRKLEIVNRVRLMRR